MTPAQVAVNAAAIRNLAAKLERWGLDDAHQRAEHIAVNLLADGLRTVDVPPPPRGPGELGGPGHREFQEAKARLKESKR